MNDQDIQNLFARLKDTSEFAPIVSDERVSKIVLESTGVDLGGEISSYGLRDYIEYYMWEFSHAMLKPMAAAVAVFIFAITGWVSLANASQTALPGEKLYPVKLSVEKAQMTLAFNADQRAGLQIEFTSRRLDEMVEVSARLHESEPQTVQLAVERFKQEVALIQKQLEEDQPESGTQELAKAVGRKVEIYSSAVSASSTDLTEDVAEEVEEIIEEAREQAVEVIITAHEVQQDEETTRELQMSFENELERAQKSGIDEETSATAQLLADQGLFRRAFQVLKEFELTLEK